MRLEAAVGAARLEVGLREAAVEETVGQVAAGVARLEIRRLDAVKYLNEKVAAGVARLEIGLRDANAVVEELIGEVAVSVARFEVGLLDAVAKDLTGKVAGSMLLSRSSSGRRPQASRDWKRLDQRC